MTRKKEIDLDRILDAADAVIVSSGGRKLTLDEVAERAGISKGGLIYSYATKDDLLSAALERDVARFEAAVDLRLGDTLNDGAARVLAHIDEALAGTDSATRKAAFLVTALVHAPAMMEPVRRYYRRLFDGLDQGEADRDIRTALLAVEGVFLLGGLGLVNVPQDEFRSVLQASRDFVASAIGKRAVKG